MIAITGTGKNKFGNTPLQSNKYNIIKMTKKKNSIVKCIRKKQVVFISFSLFFLKITLMYYRYARYLYRYNYYACSAAAKLNTYFVHTINDNIIFFSATVSQCHTLIWPCNLYSQNNVCMRGYIIFIVFILYLLSLAIMSVGNFHCYIFPTEISRKICVIWFCLHKFFRDKIAILRILPHKN